MTMLLPRLCAVRIVSFLVALWSFHRPMDVTSASNGRIGKELGRRSQPSRHLVEPSPRIINGVETERSRHPYVALLTAKFVLKCGGVMIAPDILLTAAHCTESFDEIQVGRHNRSDDTEVYQSLIVEEVVNHPMYFRNRFLDPDPHDFAVVKLYGHVGDTQQLSSSYIKINRNSNIPEPNQEMQVFGWGSINPEDFRQQSDVLRETDAYYIPNEECKTIKGKYRGFDIDFSQVVIDVTLCAMDFEDMTDSCRGDSGGGLIIRGETPEDDVLVGLVSAGYGCAHETLPALYARVSEVQEWIREHVCELSEYPPSYLDCEGKLRIDNDDDVEQTASDIAIPFDCEDILIGRDADGSLPTQSPSATGNIPCTTTDTTLVTLMLTLGLDTRPEERGWILRTKTPSGAWVTEMERPIFSYSGYASMSTVREALFLANNREYEITLLDAYGDGHEQSFSVTAVQSVLRLVDQDSFSEIVNVAEFNVENSNGYRLSAPFVLGKLPTAAPTVSPAPTMTMTPTSFPTNPLPIITVNITFDEFPQNIGFRLESLSTEDEASAEIELLHIVYPGNFAAELLDSFVLVEVPLLPPTADAQTYRFTMTSNEGKGLGELGQYQVWLGSVSNDMLLFEGDTFFYEESTTFEVDPSMLPPTTAPGMSLGFGRLEGESGSSSAAAGTMMTLVSSWSLALLLIQMLLS